MKVQRPSIWTLGVTVLLIGRVSTAQETDAERKALAEMLFNMGRDLMAEGEVAAACTKFESSLRVDPAAGTLLNLAVCHEQEGRIASAWAEFKESLALAVIKGDVVREQLAREHVEALEPLLPRVRLVIRPEATVPGLKVYRNEVVVPAESWGGAMPVDPGPVVFRAEAPGYVSETITVEALRATTVEAVIPSLAQESKPEPALTQEPPEPAPVHRPTSPPPPTMDAPTSSGWVRDAAWIGGGVGLAAVVVGSYFGVRAIQKRRESDDYCPNANLCYEEGVALNDEADVAADRSNGFVGAGIVLLGASAATLLITSPEDEADDGATERRGLRARVQAGPGAGDVSLRWVF